MAVRSVGSVGDAVGGRLGGGWYGVSCRVWAEPVGEAAGTAGQRNKNEGKTRQDKRGREQSRAGKWVSGVDTVWQTTAGPSWANSKVQRRHWYELRERRADEAVPTTRCVWSGNWKGVGASVARLSSTQARRCRGLGAGLPF